ncbi:hypothetical protein [Luteolibacter luteus]|uniref:Glycine zipper domain-containing protein n=1 Tax=Luteolibacter luteus TaxID=2728835 RepID=A0A858RMF1_9BACT|nr:hypothetical protein [Luteolibacter luteus]QJE98167.1 hypothetical protein HHL09_21050 [Luteolibacter luteus]
MKQQSKSTKGDFEPDAGGTGTAFGAGGGAIVGGIVGSLGGPGGTVIGALVGAAAGGAVGHAIGAGGWADSNEQYWRENITRQSFFQTGFNYEDYAEALRLGYEHCRSQPGGSFDENEARLATEWERVKGPSRLTWEQARHATRAAWERLDRGDF